MEECGEEDVGRMDWRGWEERMQSGTDAGQHSRLTVSSILVSSPPTAKPKRKSKDKAAFLLGRSWC